MHCKKKKKKKVFAYSIVEFFPELWWHYCEPTLHPWDVNKKVTAQLGVDNDASIHGL